MARLLGYDNAIAYQTIPVMPKKDTVQLPYFDYLFASLKENNLLVEKSFGRHVHWGYWEQPQQATGTGDDFAAAAEQLTEQLCIAANIQNGQKILDAGCGFGGTIAHLNENYSEMELSGLNLDDRQLVRAKQQVEAQGLTKSTFIRGMPVNYLLPMNPLMWFWPSNAFFISHPGNSFFRKLTGY